MSDIYLQYEPQLVIVSAGYDAAIGCPEVNLNSWMSVSDIDRICMRFTSMLLYDIYKQAASLMSHICYDNSYICCLLG